MGTLAAVEPVRVIEPTKVCANPDCPHAGQPQPWSNFWAKVKWPDGTTRQPHCYCKPCQREYARDWHKRKRDADPAWQRGRYERRYASLRSDPERWAADLARRREWKRQRHNYRRRFKRPEIGHTTIVDAAPFVAWLNSLGGSSLYKAERTGLPDSKVRALLRGDQTTVYLDTVDAAMLHADVVVDGLPQTLDDLYPLQEDTQAA